MNNKLHFFKTAATGSVVGALLLGAMTGCVAEFRAPSIGIYADPAPVVFAAQDDYIYYPGYNVYYSSSRHQYAYMEGGGWVSRPGPRGVSVDVLLASPSVRMDFHDSPANHRAAIARQYPKNWKPAAAHRAGEEKH
jgi:hypothetical protein